MKVSHFILVYSSKVSTERIAYHSSKNMIEEENSIVEEAYEKFVDLELAIHGVTTNDTAFESVQLMSTFFQDVESFDNKNLFFERITEDYQKYQLMRENVKIS